jgi:hypothetical protein
MTEERSNEHAAGQVRRLRRRVSALLDGAAPKRLTDRHRLVAAAHVGLHVKDIREGGSAMTMTEICEQLGEIMPAKPGRSSVEPFRLHRWMLKGSATDITEDLAAHYQGRAEPLRSTETYLRLLEQLAFMAGRDPLESQGALLAALDLREGKLGETGDTPLPEQRLSSLLNEHGAVMARNLDLARLFQQAERLQAGWNIQRTAAEVTDLVPEATGCFRAHEPVNRQCWLEIAAPPLPSVAIARLPFGWLPGPFRLTNDAGEFHERHGHAVAYWELHLAIGPSGPLTVGAYLLRGASVDLVLEGHTMTLPDIQDDIEQIVSGHPRAPQITLDGETWNVSCNIAPAYRTRRQGLDEDPPSETVPNIRIDPVSASSVRAWLMTPMDLVPDEGPWIGTVDRLAPLSSPTLGWIRAESIARSVEIALRDGRLDRYFTDWLNQFRPALDQFEQDWIDRTTEMDAALRQRFVDSDLMGDHA